MAPPRWRASSAFWSRPRAPKPLLAVPPDVMKDMTGDAARALADAAYRAKEIGKLGVPAGIASGLIAGALYNRYATITLPSYLGFFGGRRFVPIAAGIAGIGLALAFGGGFPLFEGGIDGLSRSVVAAGPFGLFLYGLLNRLLLVTGLHHILNNLAWFVLGDYHGASGDLKRFFAGDPSAGAFMSGFFPVMMFGLPAACLAMYRAAPPERRAGVAGLFLSLGLTSFLTGITEPIEFTFLFLAPALFAIHAVLTGVAMVVMDLIGAKLGFGFSAGLLDYVLNFGLATRPLLLIPVGLAYAGIYYLTFSWTIRRFDLKTPGRDVAAAVEAVPADERANAFVAALGGAGNLLAIDACTTRLRLHLADPARSDPQRLAALGARGTLDLGGGRVQVVVGPEADTIASRMRAIAKPSGGSPARSDRPDAPALSPDDRAMRLIELIGPESGQATARGRRLIVSSAPQAVDNASGVRTVVRNARTVHILLDFPADAVARSLNGVRS